MGLVISRISISIAFVNHMVFLRTRDGQEVQVSESFMVSLMRDKLIGRFKNSAGIFTHSSHSCRKQNRLNIMIEQYMRDDDESDCESDLEHIVRKVFNNVKDEDVSRVNFVVNALKDVKLQKAIQCLKLQNGIDKLKLF